KTDGRLAGCGCVVVEGDLLALGIEQPQERAQAAGAIERRVDIEVDRLAGSGREAKDVHVDVGIDRVADPNWRRRDRPPRRRLAERVIGIDGQGLDGYLVRAGRVLTAGNVAVAGDRVVLRVIVIRNADVISAGGGKGEPQVGIEADDVFTGRVGIVVGRQL